MNISEIQNGAIQGNVVLGDVVRDGEGLAGKGVAPLLGGDGLVVTSAGVDQMVELLKAEHADRKRDLSRARLADAVSVLTGAAVTDADKSILEKIQQDLGKIDDLQKALEELNGKLEELTGTLTGDQARLAELAVKIEATKAAIERIRKTPEEQRTEQEKKDLEKLERELDELQTEQTDQQNKVDADQKAINETSGKITEALGAVDALNAEISNLYVTLSEAVRNAIDEATKYKDKAGDDDAGNREKPKKVGELDAADKLAALLSGDTLADLIATQRRVQA